MYRGIRLAASLVEMNSHELTKEYLIIANNYDNRHLTGDRTHSRAVARRQTYSDLSLLSLSAIFLNTNPSARHEPCRTLLSPTEPGVSPLFLVIFLSLGYSLHPSILGVRTFLPSSLLCTGSIRGSICLRPHLAK